MAAEFTADAILACVNAHWALQAGAAAPGARAVALAFSLATVAAGFVALRGRRKADRRLWAAMGLVLALLAANTQMDLLAGLTEIGRCFARLGGWYGARRELQGNLMIVLAAATVAGGYLLWRWRRALRMALPALSGFALVLAVTGARAVSLHHVDSVVNFRLAGAPFGAWLELLGAAAIIVNAAWLFALITGRLKRRPASQAPAPAGQGA